MVIFENKFASPELSEKSSFAPRIDFKWPLPNGKRKMIPFIPIDV